MKQRTSYALMTLGATVGVVAAFLQTLEKLTLIQNPHATLTCNLNSVFSCTNVLNSWQASVFGFPNSIMCLGLFLVFLVAAVAGWSGSALSKGFRLSVQGLSLFTLGFALWFLEQSTFSIGSLCIFCLFCFAGLLIVNWAWLRINVRDLPMAQELHKVITKNYDTLGWVLLGLAVALIMVIMFT